MLRCLLGGCGTGKSTRLTELLRQSAEAGRRVMVLVPEQFSFEAEKRLYDRLGAQLFNRLQTYSFMTLAKDILQTYAGSARSSAYASEQEKLLFLYQAVQRCVSEGSLRLMSRRAQAPDFLLELSQIITKLRKAGVQAEQLHETAPLLADVLGDKTHDLGRLLAHYDRVLAEHGRFDSLVDLTDAAGIAEMQFFFEDAEVYIDEFDSFTGDQYKMLEVILKQAGSVTAAIRADDPAKPASGIFVGGNSTYFSLRRMAADHGLETETVCCPDYVRSAHADLAAVACGQYKDIPDAGHVHLFEAADPTTEAEWIGAQICQLLQEDPSLHCSDIVIGVKDPVYFPVLERSLERYALPCHIGSERSVLHTELIRHFLALLELALAPELRTAAILRYLKTPLSGFSADTTAMLEHFCFTWSIDREEWEKPFWAEEDEALCRRSLPFGGQSLEKLRSRLMERLRKIRRQCKGAAVSSICRTLYHALNDQKAYCSSQMEQWDEVRQKEFVMLWNDLMDILDTLVDCFGEQKLEPEVLRRNVTLLLHSCAFSTPPQTLDTIRIVDVQTARLDSPKVVFVTGVLSGQFPAEVRPDGMFSQAELQELELRDIRISRLLPELYSDELLIVSKTFSAPTEQLFLTYPLTDLSGSAAEPAAALLQIRRALPTAFLSSTEVGLTFYVRTMAAGYFHYVRHLREDTEELAALRTLLEQDKVYGPRLEKLISVSTEPVTAADPATMQALLGEAMLLSPSGIECYYNCAFQYFCKYVLGLYIPERQDLTARSGGNYTHYCLEQLLRNLGVERFLSLSREELRTEIGRLSGEFSAQNFPEAIRRNGRFQFNFRMAGQSLVQLAMHMQEDLRSGRFRPVGYEVKLSKEPDAEGFRPLSLQDGRILCRGSIDRVDLFVDESQDLRLMRVVDYKTGEKSLVPEHLADGLDMQMLIYLFALQQNGAFDNARASGVFYAPSGQPKRSSFEERSEKNIGREAMIRELYRMKGLLVETDAPWMEEDLATGSIPVIAHADEDTLFSITPEQMTHLQAHVEQKICDMADALRAGKISPEPQLRQKYSPCTNCPVADACNAAQKEVTEQTAAEKKEALLEVFGKAAQDDGKEEA